MLYMKIFLIVFGTLLASFSLLMMVTAKYISRTEDSFNKFLDDYNAKHPEIPSELLETLLSKLFLYSAVGAAFGTLLISLGVTV